jgi:type I restriction enzyme, S subunit
VRAATELKRLEDVCELFADGDWIETKDQSPSGIRLIQTGNVGNGEFKDRGEKARFVSEATFKRLRCTEIFEGDCLVSRLPDPVGRSCLLPKTGERMITAVDCTIIRFKRDLVEPKYFHYFSQSDGYFKQIEKLTTGATRQRISRSNLGTIVLPRPPLPAQQRIVAILDEIFAGLATATANAEKNLKNARELFDSVSKSLLQPPNETWQRLTLEVLLQRGWAVSHLDGNHGNDYPRKDEFISSGVPYLSANCLENDSVDMSFAKFLSPERAGLLRKGIAQNNDVLFAHNATVGPVAMLYTDEPKVILSTSLTYYRCHPDHIVPEYLAHYMRSPEFKDQYEAVMRQSTRNQVPITKQRQFFHVIPPLIEQRRIAEKLDSLMDEVKRLDAIYKHRSTHLSVLKQSILQKAFSGEVTSRLPSALEEAAE